MICLFSTSWDRSTADVIRWLRYLGVQDILRINSDDSEDIVISVAPEGITFRYRERDVRVRDIESVWYRKGQRWVCNRFSSFHSTVGSRFDAHVSRKMDAEEAVLSEFFHAVIEQTARTLGSASKRELNKLLALKAAQEAGFAVPNVYISNSRGNLLQALGREPAAITKALSDGLYHADSVEKLSGYFTYTEEARADMLHGFPERIPPTMLQTRIDKKLELRVFFLEDTFYAMAILSQSDEQTRVDCRRYNEERPNRTVPYRLPEKIENQLRTLFRTLGLNTGSADLVLDQTNTYYFLEINPVGQFGMVSRPCNYYLEKRVALFLAQNGKER